MYDLLRTDTHYSFASERFLVILTCIWISAIILLGIRKCKLGISDGAVLMTLGAALRMLLLLVNIPNPVSVLTKQIIVGYVFIPVVMYQSSFCIDFHALYKSAVPVCLMSFLGTIICLLMSGFVMRQVLDPEWSVGATIMFGICCTTTFPSEVARHLQALGSGASRVCRIFLEGEFLFGTSVAISVMPYLNALQKEEFLNKSWGEHLYLFCTCTVFPCLLGVVIGIVGKFVLRYFTDTYCIIVITISLPYIGAGIGNCFEFNCLWTYTILGLIMSHERLSLAKETDDSVVFVWRLIFNLVVTYTYYFVGAVFLFDMLFLMYPRDYVLIVITYLMSTFTRFFCFVLFFPLLKRTGYGMTFEDLEVCSSGGLRGPFFMLAFWYKDILDSRAFVQLLGLFYLTHFINSPLSNVLFKYMGYYKISLVRQINMNICLKYVDVKRNDLISALKKDRFLADSNWPVVMKATELQHPYKTDTSQAVEEGLYTHKGFRQVHCSDCRKNIFIEPTRREMLEITREARLRVLKATKISFSKQYENGMMSSGVLKKLLAHIEKAMDSQEAVLKIDHVFKEFSEKDYFMLGRVRKFLDRLFALKKAEIRPPRRPFRRVLYHIVESRLFDFLIYVTIVVNVTKLICQAVEMTTNNVEYFFQFYYSIFGPLFGFIYVLEFFMKILAYSFIYIWADGVKTYFASKWNILEFVLVLFIIPDWVISAVYVLTGHPRSVYLAFIYMRFLRALRLLKIIILCNNIYRKVTQDLDKQIELKIAAYYELCKALITATDEILEALPKMIDRKDVMTEIQEEIHQYRLLVMRYLGVVQNKKPAIAITVKTIQAIRTILNGMSEVVEELKVSGWVDSREYRCLKEVVQQRHKYVKFHVKSVKPNTPKLIFEELLFLEGENSKIKEFLYRKAELKKYKAGEYLMLPGQPPTGIYVLIEGLACLSYKPTPEIVEKMEDFGFFPTIDNLPYNKFREGFVDYLVPGNCWGRRSILTDRCCDVFVRAESDCKVLLLKKSVVQEAMKMKVDNNVNGLEGKLWRSLCIHNAISILLDTPGYQNDTEVKIKHVLEKAFSPSLVDYKYFIVTDSIEDLILVEGLAVDYTTKNLYTAPRYIPRNVRKLALPQSSYLNLPSVVQTRFLVVPAEGADEDNVVLDPLLDQQQQTYSEDVLMPAGQQRSTMFALFPKLNQIKSNKVEAAPSQTLYTGESDARSQHSCRSHVDESLETIELFVRPSGSSSTVVLRFEDCTEKRKDND